MTPDILSGSGMTRINFKPYTKDQLVEIIKSRLQRATDGASNTRDVMRNDAIVYVAARISRISGDARRVLDICRRTVEKMREVQPLRPATINDIKEVVDQAQNTPTSAFIEGCSYHEKIMLAASLLLVRWKGVEEFTWADVSLISTQPE